LIDALVPVEKPKTQNGQIFGASRARGLNESQEHRRENLAVREKECAPACILRCTMKKG